jgi:hypothetical protein
MMVATSTNKGKINPTIVGPNKGGSGSAARGSAEPVGKKAAYKPRIVAGWDDVSSNYTGRRQSAREVVPPKGDSAAGSPLPRRKSRHSPKAACRRRSKKGCRLVTVAAEEMDNAGYKVNAQAPASPTLRGAKGTSNSEDDYSSDGDISEDGGEEANGQDAPLRYGMEELQQCLYVEGSVALVFAQQVTKERVAGQDANHAFARTSSNIFGGSKNADPIVVKATLGASEARAYLVVINEDRGFTLVHHLARLDRELCPGNLIVNKIVAFGDDIQKGATISNVWVFKGKQHELFFRLHLPDANLKETQLFYSNETKGNNSSSLFAMDPATNKLGRGPVTLIIPIPMKWASLFVDNPSFGSAIWQMFDLFDSLTKDEQVNCMPILEMMATACCGMDNSGGAKSTLSSKWAQLRFHAGTKCWAAEAWAALTSPPVKECAPLQVIPVVQSPKNRVRDLFGNQPRQPAVIFPRAATAPLVAPQAAAIGMNAMDMGDMMVKVLKAQAKANLALHKSYQTDMHKNIRLTGPAVVATGSSKDARLTESKLRILRACSGHDDGLPFTPSKLYIKVEKEGGAKDTFGWILCQMAVTVQGVPTSVTSTSPQRLWRR